jgi:hypothetical protein
MAQGVEQLVAQRQSSGGGAGQDVARPRGVDDSRRRGGREVRGLPAGDDMEAARAHGHRDRRGAQLA